MISISTNLAGRLRNTPLPLGAGLLPVYEAVINSIHAIEDTNLRPEQGEIKIEILRKPKTEQLSLEDTKKRGPDALEDIIGFRITDNGIGFTDENMKSFCMLDSDYKADKGGRGIGRLLWLKAFDRVRIHSVYSNGGDSLKTRSFTFDAGQGITDEQTASTEEERHIGTIVCLEGFMERYRENSRKTAEAIGSCILEHCLWYFVREGGAPSITVSDADERIDLDTLYEKHMHSSTSRESITLKERDFHLIHVKFRSGAHPAHAIALCADNRLVTEEKLAGKIPGLRGRLFDESGEFVYVCYVSSPFLNEVARPQRTGFDVPDTVDGLFANMEISRDDIHGAVATKAAEHLADYLEANIERAKERIESFVATKAPRYRPILSRIHPEKLDVDPDATDKELDLLLHKQLSEIEGGFLAEGHDIMTPAIGEGVDAYRQRLSEYLKTAEDIKKSDLANYVSHRRVILDLLELAIQRGENGKYAREDLIHNLIMPMRQTSKDVMFDSCNLWLVDERLAFHDYLASDKTINAMPITDSKSTKEPDIVSLNIYDNPILTSDSPTAPFASLTVVEIKRPMRDDAEPGEERDPVEQCLGYLERIREGNVTTSLGRPIPNAAQLPGFCYVLCDLTDSIIDRCKKHSMMQSYDGMGFFHYNPNYNAYIEVISFDKLVQSAKERNRAFFDKLGLPAK
jgi:hypothetical protein